MCGIFAYLNNIIDYDQLKYGFNKIRNRGPDASYLLNFTSIYMGFHRLKINDMSINADQPFSNGNIHLICNGEIYNFKKIKEKYDIKTQSQSDCEVIIYLYKKFGIKKTCQILDGVFSFVLYDSEKQEVYCGRDPYGVRPMFIGYDNNEDIYLSSEIKGIHELCIYIKQFKPGYFMKYNLINKRIKVDCYHNFNYKYELIENESTALSMIKELFIRSVRKRLMSDRPIGCLLSGGLDSSLVASIVNFFFNKSKSKSKLNTFAIGLEGATDLKYAMKVADHIHSKHTSVILKEEEFLNAIPDVIYAIESYDTTTVRASVGNYLISKYIKENTDITVVYNGDGSDELGGYIYLKNAPNKNEFQNEINKLIKNIHYFDVLRSDRSMSSKWGLETRTPFLDKEFISMYMSIQNRFKAHDRIEKHLLREAFSNTSLLPKDVLWRKKEAFSDGCSSKERSWHKIIQEHVDKEISDEEFEIDKLKYKHNPPQLKESLYYRRIFNKFYPGRENVIPYYWLPNWTSEKDPSARELTNY